MLRTGVKYRSLDQAKLRTVLNYDGVTGIFTWRVSNSNRVKIGSVAGTMPAAGRRIIRIGSYNYHASNLAWLFTYGRWPVGDVDHKGEYARGI